MKRFGLGIRRPSESDEEKKSGFLPSLASRRSSRRSQLFGSKDKIVAPIDTASNGSGEPNSKQLRDVRRPSNIAEESKDAKSKKAQGKPTKKWNFFQRAQASSPRKTTFETRVPDTILAQSRSVAHYALDATPQGNDGVVEELDFIMKEAQTVPTSHDLSRTTMPLQLARSTPTNRPVAEHVHSVLLPSPPILQPSTNASQRAASPQVQLRKEHQKDFRLPSEETEGPLQTSNMETSRDEKSSWTLDAGESTMALPQAFSPPRPSRLAQVGRIPLVIPQNEKERKPSVQSFSRPFAYVPSRPILEPPRTSMDSLQSPILAETNVLRETFPAYSSLSTPFNQAVFDKEVHESMDVQSKRSSEFLSFPPRRKDSEMSSSSSGFWSLRVPTAIIPAPGAPPGEDEVWKEYDDLIDDVLSPSHESARSSFTVSFPNSDKLDMSAPRNGLDVVPTLKNGPSSVSDSVSSMNATKSVHLRRSRLLAALHAASPKSTASVSDFAAIYGDRHPSVVDPVTGRLSLPSSHHDSISSRPRSSIRHSAEGPSRESKCTSISSSVEDGTSNRYRDTKLVEMAADSGASMADLRFGALMTSKWLSFGRVLFSPVHFELKNPAEDRVLVIDGLGKGKFSNMQ
jgi:hypothetical protein